MALLNKRRHCNHIIIFDLIINGCTGAGPACNPASWRTAGGEGARASWPGGAGAGSAATEPRPAWSPLLGGGGRNPLHPPKARLRRMSLGEIRASGSRPRQWIVTGRPRPPAGSGSEASRAVMPHKRQAPLLLVQIEREGSLSFHLTARSLALSAVIIGLCRQHIADVGDGPCAQPLHHPSQ